MFPPCVLGGVTWLSYYMNTINSILIFTIILYMVDCNWLFVTFKYTCSQLFFSPFTISHIIVVKLVVILKFFLLSREDRKMEGLGEGPFQFLKMYLWDPNVLMVTPQTM